MVLKYMLIYSHKNMFLLVPMVPRVFIERGKHNWQNCLYIFTKFDVRNFFVTIGGKERSDQFLDFLVFTNCLFDYFQIFFTEKKTMIAQYRLKDKCLISARMHSLFQK